MNTLAGLSLRDLEYAVAVRRLRHFGRAAAHCNVSQPTLSEQIRKLEALLGVTLFERTRRRVEVTGRGDIILDRAARILADAHAMLDLGREIGVPLTGKLSLGAIETLGPYYLPRILEPVRTAYPGLELRLFEDKTARLLDRIRAGDLDAALVAMPMTEEALVSVPLFFEPFVLVCPTGHRLADHPLASGRDLEGDDLLLLEEGHCLRDQALALCQSAHAPRTRHATSLETLWSMIAAGEGYSLLPALSCSGRAHLSSLVGFRALPDLALGRTIGLVWRASDPRGAEFSKLAALLRTRLPEAVRGLPCPL